jgi:hypothetical protein
VELISANFDRYRYSLHAEERVSSCKQPNIHRFDYIIVPVKAIIASEHAGKSTIWTWLSAYCGRDHINMSIHDANVTRDHMSVHQRQIASP